MNTLSGDAEPYATLTLDGLNATTTLIDDAVGNYLPLTGGTLATSGTTRLGIASNTQGTVEFTDTAGTSKALVFYNATNNDVSFTVGTNTRVLRVGGTQITAARNISLATTNKVVNLSPGTTTNDAVNYGQTMLRSGVNAATANIPMGGFKLTGLGLGVAGDDAATVSQLTASPHFYLPLAGGTMTGNLVINRGVNPCIFTLASAGNTTIDFKDDNLVLKGSMQYNQPANSLHFDLAGVTRQTISTTATTFSTPVAMSSQKITGLLAGAGGSTDAANVAQMEAADTVVTNAYIAADALKLNRSGVGAMTGALDMGGFLIQQVNAGAAGSTNAANVAQMEAADASVTNAYIAANTAQTTAITNAYIAADTVVTNAYIAANTAQTTAITNAYIAADTVVTNAYIAANTAQTTAITNAYIAADTVVTNAYIAANTAQTTAITSSYVAADAAVVASSLQKGGGTMTGDITFSSGNIHMGTGYIGLQAGVAATDAVNKGQLDTKTYLRTSATSNGTFTIADPSSNLTTLTFRNEYTLLGSPLGTCYFITEAQSQLWIKANVTTHAKESGIQLDAGTFIFFTGDPSSPTQRFSYDASATNQMNIYGTLNMRTNKIIGVTAGTVSTDGVNYGQTMLLSGSNAMTADLAMGTHKITGVTAGTVSTDAVNYGQTMLRDGTNAMTAQLYMGNFRIGNLSPALSSLDAVNYGQTVLRDGTNAMTGILNMGLNIISNCGPASSPTDVVTYTQITNKFVPITGGAAAGQAMTGHLYMGTNRISGCGVAVSAADVVVYSQIQQSTIPLTAWRVGETVQRKWYSPELSNNLSNSTCAASSNVVVVTINMNVTSGNKIFINGQFNIDANDQFTMRAGFSTQYTDYVNQPTTVNFRDRTYNFHALFIPSSSGSKTISWKIFNESTSGTLTISTLNWLFSIEEVQS
jgi:hypothetical protein